MKKLLLTFAFLLLLFNCFSAVHYKCTYIEYCTLNMETGGLDNCKGEKCQILVSIVEKEHCIYWTTNEVIDIYPIYKNEIDTNDFGRKVWCYGSVFNKKNFYFVFDPQGLKITIFFLMGNVVAACDLTIEKAEYKEEK